ncbi:DUF3472 domain-containing protein [Pontibacter russatus]|uniref:DUF3472 domain-containing protein n=1 Tax=Pontibacter russatus TaxID=2694929 RepID=UPI001F2FDC4D|nr:DUF3472 domain-containing protein [Pontibacter russatus]
MPPGDRPVPENAVVVPMGGNTWKTEVGATGGTVDNSGITGWTGDETAFTAYVRFAKKGMVKIWLNLRVPDGAVSRIKVTALDESRTIKVRGAGFKDWYVGEWQIADTGYVAFTITGVSKKGRAFADVASLKLSGNAVNEDIAFVKNNEGNFFYWGRRGPSVHLSYPLPQGRDIEWFYNEVTVPEGNDVIGSYYMANGFAEGYFGMQVNSASERRILFSVWSPFQTDDPAQIPDGQKIRLLGKGKDVNTGEFGNEGAGGQSYWRYNWKAGTTYRFLLRGAPTGQNTTVYTAYFFAPEEDSWMLIASFERPQTSSYLRRTHSFLENFIPDYGNEEREVLFSNQWARDTEGNWVELNEALFTGDNTASVNFRMDYGGGLKGASFYLRNCGFFSDYTPLRTRFERPKLGKAPQIDWQGLPD